MTVTLALAKQHLRLDSADEDTLVSAYLAAAVAQVEGWTGKLLTRRAAQQTETALRGYVMLDFGPAPADVSMAYIDSDGAPQTIDDAMLAGGRLYRPDGWPATAAGSEVVISYTAGFDTTPSDLDAAVLLLVGDHYANRDAGKAAAAVTAAVEALCRPYRAVHV